MNVPGHITALLIKQMKLEEAILEENKRPLPDDMKLNQLKLERLQLEEEINSYTGDSDTIH